MARKVTNADLLKTCYASTHEAADDVTRLDAVAGPLPVELLTALRNRLREALAAVQELKTRVKRGMPEN